METNLIRLRDGKVTWIHADGLSAELEELPFKAASSHGQYLSLSLGQRKAAVFPFEIFSVDGETYYFGPEPSCHQIVRPARIKWIRPSERHITPSPNAFCVHALVAVLILTFRSALMAFRSSALRHDVSPVSKRYSRALLLRSSAGLAVLTLALLALKPKTIHAPTPSAEQRIRTREVLNQIETIQNMRSALLAQSLSISQGSLITSTRNSTTLPTTNATKPSTVTYPKQNKRDCRLSERVSAFLSPTQLREHFEKCKSNEY